MSQHIDTTAVAAIVTPPGEGGIGVVKVAGTGAFEVVDAIFEPARPSQWASRRPGRLHYGRIRHAGRTLDEVIIAVLTNNTETASAPAIDINCHGGIAAVHEVLECLAQHNVQTVDAIEFMHCYPYGSDDAVRRDAVEALLSAIGEDAASMLVDQWNGALSRKIEDAATLFHDDDAETATATLHNLLTTADFGIALASPPRVVIAGAPNAGKSTLFNAIVGHPRVIVADVPGTTRDAVAEMIVLDGIPFELTDTAGLRDTDHVVEVESIKGTWRRVAEADIVIMLLDGSRPTSQEEWRIADDLKAPRVIVAINKCELPALIDEEKIVSHYGSAPYRISAATGEGLDALETALAECVAQDRDFPPGAAIVFTERQRDAIARAIEAPAGDAAEILRNLM